MYNEKAFRGWKSWHRVFPVRLLPLFVLLFTCFVANVTPTPVLASTGAPIFVEFDDGEDAEPVPPTFTAGEREVDPDDLDPHALALRDAYLDHDRFRGGAGFSTPQLDGVGYRRGFEARGPPAA